MLRIDSDMWGILSSILNLYDYENISLLKAVLEFNLLAAMQWLW